MNRQKNQTKQNYQKILDRTIEELQSSYSVFRHYCFTVVVHRAKKVMCWSICRSIFKLRCYTTTRIFIRMKSIKKEWQSKRSSSNDSRQKTGSHL